MQHSFDVEVAKLYTVPVAIFLNNIAFWIEHNIANDKHFYEGRYWTFNSVKAFAVLFPYWTEKQVRTTINNAIEAGLIIVGNFNKQGYDQTHWYALTERGMLYYPSLNSANSGQESIQTAPDLICPKGQMDLPKRADLYQIVNADGKQNNKPPFIPPKKTKQLKPVEYPEVLYEPPKKTKSLSVDVLSECNPHNIPEQMLDDWKASRKAPITVTAWNRLNKELEKFKKVGRNPIDEFERMVSHGWQSLSFKWSKDNKTDDLDHTSTAWIDDLEGMPI